MFNTGVLCSAYLRTMKVLCKDCKNVKWLAHQPLGGFNVSLNGAIAVLHPDAIELEFKQRATFRYHSNAVDLDEKFTARDGDTAAGD